MDDTRGTPDVTALPLAQLVTARDGVLDDVLRRLLADLEHAQTYAAFGSAI